MARPKLMARSGMKTTLVVAAIIVGVVLGVNIVNAAVPLPEAYVDQGVNPAITVQPTDDPNQTQPTDDPNQPQPTDDPNQPQPTADPGQAVDPTSQPLLATPAPVDPGPVTGGSTITVNEHFTFVMPDGWSLVDQQDGALVFQKGNVTFAVAGTGFDGTVTELATAYRDIFFQDGNLRGEDPAVGATTTGIPVAGLNYTGTLNNVQVDGFILAALDSSSGMVSNTFGPTGTLQSVSDDIDMILNSIRRVGE
jgi:hypothetical protein